MTIINIKIIGHLKTLKKDQNQICIDNMKI